MTEFKTYKPVTSGMRHRVDIISDISSKKPEKNLRTILKKHSGRNTTGRVTVRHQGGRHKRFWRIIDFRRDKLNIKGRVVSLEYDPNRGANIALLHYRDGEKRYILAPLGLQLNDMVEAGPQAELKPGNSLALAKIPVGMPIHNVEITPGRGGQVVRGAGTSAVIQSKEGNNAVVKFPSGELRKINLSCIATIGQIGNINLKDIKFGKAGRKRWLGVRPSVRGTAMHPDSHPHGGGEGRTGEGMPSPKTPWGKKTRGFKTRKKKRYSDKFIVQGRPR